MNVKVRQFYETFISTIYGFILVLGFQGFISIKSSSPLAPFAYLLLATAYITVLHFWLVFFIATDDTFHLILAGEHSSTSTKMLWFWTELVFATLFSVPMLEMFSAITDVKSFTFAVMLIAFWSLLWDLWAFSVHHYISKKRGSAIGSAGTLLFKWIGLDIFFSVTMLILYGILRDQQHHPSAMLVSVFLLAVSILGSILDTIIINPSLFLSSTKEIADGQKPPAGPMP